MTGPAIWGSLLPQLDAAADRCLLTASFIVAGGPVRDYMLGLPAKDIDVFTYVDNAHDFDMLLDELPEEFDMALHEYDEDYVNDDPVTLGVATGTWTHNDVTYSVDIICRAAARKGGAALVSTFDFASVQGWYAPKEAPTVQGTALFDTDLANGTATLLHDRHVEDSYNRWARFNERHPDRLAFNDPHGFKTQLEMPFL